jgi:hypothetical protein
MDKPVLVDAGQLVETPEGIVPKVCPSVIRLEALDDRLRCWGDALDLGETAGRDRDATPGGLVEARRTSAKVPCPGLVAVSARAPAS